MAATNHKEISLRQIILAKSCIHSALTSQDLRERAHSMSVEEKRSHKRLVKDAARKLLNDNQHKAEAKAKDVVATLTLSEQKSILRKARVMVESRIAGLEEGDDVQMGVQQRWHDRETGWTILFQPNRVETLSDENGEYKRVIGWTGGKRITSKQKEMARMFGLLQYIKGRGEMRIQMVFESLTQDETLWEEWLDSPTVALERLLDIRETIGRIEDARLSERVPPRKSGKHCKGCPVHRACRQGYKFLVREGMIEPEPTQTVLSGAPSSVKDLPWMQRPVSMSAHNAA